MTSRRSLLVIDAGLLLGAFAVPFAFGGRHSIGEFLLVCSAVVCVAGWIFHQLTSEESDWVRTRVEPLLLAILALGLIQIVPLPHSIVSTLSPAMDDVLPLRSASAVEDGVFRTPWSHLSMSVSESAPGLAIGVAYVLIFLVTAQRIRAVDDASRILKIIALSGVAMTFFAFVQFFFSNGLYFWLIDLPQGVADDRLKGAFLNKNHFAQFAALSVGPLVWWLGVHTAPAERQRFDGSRRKRSQRPVQFLPTVLLAAALGAVVTAVLISRARGAFVALSVASIVLVAILYSKSLINRKQFAAVAAAVAMGVLLVGIVGHRELARVSERLHDWDSNGRVQIWNANLDVFSEFPLVGTGVGSHVYIHQRHLDQPYSVAQYTHAESSYLQIASETGVPGLVLMTACLAVAFYWCIRGVRFSQNRTVTLALCGVTCSLLISCIQSVADFVWYIPGCMLPLVLQLACACRLYQLEADTQTAPKTSRVWQLPRFGVAVAALMLLPLCGWMFSEWTPRLLAEPYWANYRKVVLAGYTGKDIASSVAGDPESETATLQQIMRDLRNAAQNNPNDSRIQTRLAVQYGRVFHLLQAEAENALPLSQIRDAAETGGFETHHEMLDWLTRAFGDNIKYVFAAKRHARRAIELNPLDGRAWLAYSELAFLDDAPEGYDRKCIDQCLRLLPNDASVLYAAGREARVDGDVERWVELWKKAFHRDEAVQKQIIRRMAEWTELPVEIIVKAFEPDVDAMDRTVEILSDLGQDQNKHKALEVLAARLIERAQLEDNTDRATDWRKAAVAFHRLDNVEQVEVCFENAAEAAPTNFRVRFDYGSWLLTQGRPASATEHLQWCQRMAPHDASVQKAITALQRAVRQSRNIRQASATSIESVGR
ncbi:MAG: O-antigen ligase/tetratricopeptide (TPR) repeat protein [Planctomycetaceae bacterium]|jgi:O-antigen ligase/tetratricopeptide (TPR) repeat protein